MSNAITKLYEASAAARELEAMLLDSDGELTEAMDGHFDILAKQAESLPAAIDDVLSLVREIEVRAEARKAEAKRLQQRARRDESVAEWMRGKVLELMQSQGFKKLECSRWRVTVAMPGGKPALEMISEPTDEYTEVVTEVHPNTDKIRAALEAGEVLHFARLVPKAPYLKVS